MMPITTDASNPSRKRMPARSRSSSKATAMLSTTNVEPGETYAFTAFWKNSYHQENRHTERPRLRWMRASVLGCY
jgi:hypothetical protein